MSADEEPEIATTRVTRKGQVTIPKALREEYDLEPGDELRWVDTEDGITIRKATRSAGRGMLVGDDASQSDREAIAEAMEADIREKRRDEWSPE